MVEEMVAVGIKEVSEEEKERGVEAELERSGIGKMKFWNIRRKLVSVVFVILDHIFANDLT